jgi:hypothetical protein
VSGFVVGLGNFSHFTTIWFGGLMMNNIDKRAFRGNDHGSDFLIVPVRGDFLRARMVVQGSILSSIPDSFDFIVVSQE